MMVGVGIVIMIIALGLSMLALCKRVESLEKWRREYKTNQNKGLE